MININNFTVNQLINKIRCYIQYNLNKFFCDETMIIKYLGCSKKRYYEYLKSHFSEGMNYDNYNSWEIDHTIPLTFNNPSKQEIIKRFYYKNTKPMWKTDNRLKGNRFIGNNLLEFEDLKTIIINKQLKNIFISNQDELCNICNLIRCDNKSIDDLNLKLNDIINSLKLNNLSIKYYLNSTGGNKLKSFINLYLIKLFNLSIIKVKIYNRKIFYELCESVKYKLLNFHKNNPLYFKFIFNIYLKININLNKVNIIHLIKKILKLFNRKLTIIEDKNKTNNHIYIFEFNKYIDKLNNYKYKLKKIKSNKRKSLLKIKNQNYKLKLKNKIKNNTHTKNIYDTLIMLNMIELKQLIKYKKLKGFSKFNKKTLIINLIPHIKFEDIKILYM